MSCTQNIVTDQDCLFFTYLNNCSEDRIYPPLRLYEQGNFVVVRGADAKEISVEITDFEAILDGVTYTDKDDFILNMLVQMNCVNNSKTGLLSQNIQELILQGDCKDKVFGFNLNGASFPAEVTDGVRFYYWNGSSWALYEDDLTSYGTINNLNELVSALNANQTYFEFYVLPLNTYPAQYNSYIAIKSLDNNVTTEIQNNSFVLQIDGVDVSGTKTDLGFAQCDSNSDAIRENTDTIKEIVDGSPLASDVGGLQTYTPPVANQAQLIDTSDVNRNGFIFQAINGDCFLRFTTNTDNPTLRTQRSILVKEGQTITNKPSNNGRLYTNALSVINVQDGTTFDFVFLKFIKSQ